MMFSDIYIRNNCMIGYNVGVLYAITVGVGVSACL